MDTQKIIQGYDAVFGRPPQLIHDTQHSPPVRCCWFPAVKAGFWKRLSAEAPDFHIWVTAGLSNFAMLAQSKEGETVSRIELMAVAEKAIGAGPLGEEDMISQILEWTVAYIVDQQVPVNLGDTIDFGVPLSSNGAMTGCFFTLPPAMDLKRVRRCSLAKDILGLMPLTAAEIDFKRNEGVEALIDRFEAADVPSTFDVFRPSVV